DISMAAKEAAAGQLEAIKIKYEEALELRKKAELDIETFRPVGVMGSGSGIGDLGNRRAAEGTSDMKIHAGRAGISGMNGGQELGGGGVRAGTGPEGLSFGAPGLSADVRGEGFSSGVMGDRSGITAGLVGGINASETGFGRGGTIEGKGAGLDGGIGGDRSTVRGLSPTGRVGTISGGKGDISGVKTGYGSSGYDGNTGAYVEQAVELTERRTVLIR
ncbi:hypothetical protein XENOCAPTIV_017861, partial [Xenoophorus captivus]